MDFLWDKITEWLKEMLIGGIVSNLSGMFDATNQKVAEISGQVGLSPQAWNSSIFNMIQNLSETVIVPIAGAILAFVMTLELIQLITDKNTIPLRTQTDGSAVSSTPRKPPLPRRSSSLSGMRSRTGFGKTRSGAKRWYGNTTRK